MHYLKIPEAAHWQGMIVSNVQILLQIHVYHDSRIHMMNVGSKSSFRSRVSTLNRRKSLGYKALAFSGDQRKGAVDVKGREVLFFIS